MTDFRASQDTLEAWIRTVTQARTSQAFAEAWITLPPPTAFWVSQDLLEVWETRPSPTTTFIVSQELAEVWLKVAPAAPAVRRVFLSSQVV